MPYATDQVKKQARSKTTTKHNWNKRYPTSKPCIYYSENASGKRSYQITYTDSNGKQRWETTGSSFKDAEVALGKRKSDLRNGKRVAPKPRQTFGEVAAEYREADLKRLAASTQRSYAGHLDNHLLPAWEKKALKNFTRKDVLRLITEKEGEYKGWTIKGMLNTAGAVFTYARDELDYAGENPISLLKKAHRPKTTDAKDWRILTGPEIEALLDAARAADKQGKPTSYAIVLDFALNTGVRLGELLALRWGDIDFGEGTATIKRQINGQGEILPLKAKRDKESGERALYLPSGLVSRLAAHQLQSRYSAPSEYAFATANGTTHGHRNVSKRLLERLCERAGIAEPHPTMHDLRHTYASAYIAAGGDVVTLSADLGHASPDITMRVYMHEFDRAKRRDEHRQRVDQMYQGARKDSALNVGGESSQETAIA